MAYCNGEINNLPYPRVSYLHVRRDAQLKVVDGDVELGSARLARAGTLSEDEMVVLQ